MHFGGRSWSKKHCETAGILQRGALGDASARRFSVFLRFKRLGCKKKHCKTAGFLQRGACGTWLASWGRIAQFLDALFG